MNGQPHVHTVRIVKEMPFPYFVPRWYVLYGDQKVIFGAASSFLQRFRNPEFWTPEKRERRIASALAKVIAKHDHGSKKAAQKDAARRQKAAQKDAARRHMEQLAQNLQPGINKLGYMMDGDRIATWPSEAEVKVG